MKPYMFVIKGVPSKDNQDCLGIAGAYIHIWVMDSSIQSAKHKAIEYIKKYLWEPLGFEHEFEISSEQLASLHEDEMKLYQKAVHFGIAAEFLAYQSDDSDVDSSLKHHPFY